MEPKKAFQTMRLFQCRPITGWKPTMATLVIASCLGCASFNTPKDPPKVTHSEPSFLKKAAEWVTPRKKASPLLPYQRDLKFARHQFNSRNYDRAEFYLKKTLLQVADEPSALKLLPWTYFFQQRYDKALMAFERNHAAHRKDASSLTGMAWCYLSMNNFPQALNNFSKAEKISDRIYDIHKGRAILFLKQQNPDKALPSLRKIYDPFEVESILAFWQTHENLKTNSSLPVVPGPSGEPSLFSLPVEHPRYRSILWTLNQQEDEALEKAWRYYRKKLYRRALQAFQDLPESVSHSLDAQNGLAWSYLKTKEIIKAEQVFENLSQRHPKFVGVVKGIQATENFKMQKAGFAKYYLDLEKPRIAEQKFEALTEEFPDWAYPYSQLGLLAIRNGDAEAASEYLQTSLELEPGNEEGLKGLHELQKIRDPDLYEANQALKTGDYKQAASLFHYYIEDQKHRTQLTEPLAGAYLGLGWSQFHKGQYKQAIEKFKQVRRHEKFKPDAVKGLGLSFFHLKKFREAAFFLQTAQETYPDEKQVSHTLDWSIMKSWSNARARQYFERELQRHPLRPSLYIGLGWVYFQQDKPDLAVEYFLKSISLNPDAVVSEEFFKFLGSQRFGWQVYNRLGWAYYHQEDYTRASEMFQVSIKEQPYKSEAHKGMGYSLYRMEKYGPAIKYLKLALEFNTEPDPVLETIGEDNGKGPFKTDTTVRSKLAKAYFHLGNSAEAIRYYQQVLTLHPNLSDAYNGLGWVYLQLHRLTESRAAFTRAVQLDPMNRLSHKGLREVKQLLATRNIRIKKPAFPENSPNSPPSES